MKCFWQKTLIVALLPLVSLVAALSFGPTAGAQETAETTPATVDLTEQEHLAEIRRLMAAQDVDGLVLAWRGATAGHPNSALIWTSGNSVASMLMRNSQPELADSIITEVIEGLKPLAQNDQAAANGLGGALSISTNICAAMSKEQTAIDRYDQAIAAVEGNGQAADQLRRGRVNGLLMLKRFDEALAQADAGKNAAFERLTEQPVDVATRVSLVNWGVLKATAHAQAQPEAREETLSLWTQAIDVLDFDFVEENAANPELLNTWANTQLRYVSVVGADDPQQANDILQRFKTQFADIEANLDPVPESLVAIERSIASAEQRLAVALKHQTLIGQPSTPILPAAWVNGAPIAPEDLKGKVVLIDFWAVWCGPCIATFPHLKDWNERYSEQGLVTIGVTSYYKYDWDAATSRSIRKDELSAEAEHAALEQFAAHHELKHVFAVTDTNELQQFFGVTGIPQAVLIDRDGRVRMIKVGSGEQNARELEAMIEQLLGE